MGSSFELGRIAGIRIGLHWSWLIVFTLFVWILAGSVFPSTNPDLGDGTHLVMAFVAAALFFLSVLLHELGHAFQARREQIEIEGITLWLFGGVATLKGSFRSAGAEFRIAVAGPVVSLLLGILFVGIALLATSQPVEGVAAWLGYINIALLVFNLAPAVPLDGGRILHAALWHFKGDFGRASRTATAMGRGFGFVLIGLGVASFIFGSTVSGVWLVFLGWFLLAAAGAEGQYAAARHALEGLRVRDLMAPDPVAVSPDLTLADFMDEVVWRRRHTTYPVVENGQAVGLLPFRRVAEVSRADWDVRRVGDCMLGLADVPTYAPDEDALEAFSELTRTSVGRGLVLEGERLVGLLSVTDLARALEAPPRRHEGMFAAETRYSQR
jgi:Zn-dependent protease/CBS domain-containing protein